MHARVWKCVALFRIAADMELAEEDGIVRIRQRDFTKRGLLCVIHFGVLEIATVRNSAAATAALRVLK